MSTPEWNADIITADDGSVDIAVNGGLVENDQGEIGVSVDGETIVINSDGELQANIPTPDTVDQVYDSTSTHAQSGVAMAGALADYTPTASLATVATSGSYDDLQDKPEIPPDNVFVATYGTTTYQEISAAKAAGKVIFVTNVSGSLSAVMPMTSFSVNPAMAIFMLVIGDIEYQAKIDQGVWSSTSVSLQADWNEANQLSPAYIANKPTVDQVFDSTSTHAQSGVAMAGVLPTFGTVSI